MPNAIAIAVSDLYNNHELDCKLQTADCREQNCRSCGVLAYTTNKARQNITNRSMQTLTSVSKIHDVHLSAEWQYSNSECSILRIEMKYGNVRTNNLYFSRSFNYWIRCVRWLNEKKTRRTLAVLAHGTWYRESVFKRHELKNRLSA